MIVVALTYSKHVQIEVLNETPRMPLNKRIFFRRLGHSTIKSYHQVAKKKNLQPLSLVTTSGEFFNDETS